MVEIRITYLRRPWWGLGLLGRIEQVRMFPPPEYTYKEIREWVENFESTGADVEVIYN